MGFRMLPQICYLGTQETAAAERPTLNLSCSLLAQSRSHNKEESFLMICYKSLTGQVPPLYPQGRSTLSRGWRSGVQRRVWTRRPKFLPIYYHCVSIRVEDKARVSEGWKVNRGLAAGMRPPNWPGKRKDRALEERTRSFSSTELPLTPLFFCFVDKKKKWGLNTFISPRPI